MDRGERRTTKCYSGVIRNTWHQRPLARLVRDCLNEHIDCGGQRS
jgi:hypothetical protein